MGKFIKVYCSLLICIAICFTSSNYAFCYASEGDYLSHIISFLGGNKQFIAQENKTFGTPTNISIFNILDYGAKGDEKTDDSKAFLAAFGAACKVNGGVILVPTGSTFLLQPLIFTGNNCQPNIVFQVDGKIVAPSTKLGWVNVKLLQWILFTGFSNGLTIRGNGLFDGHGEAWWIPKHPDTLDYEIEPIDPDSINNHSPHAICISRSVNVTVTGITIQNSPKMHIFIEDIQYVKVYNLTTSSPANSPNTDGIHLSSVQHADVYNSTLACGDDCVSIQTGCSNIKIYDVNCGPGHGYSIGGLGPNGREAQVSNILVANSTVADSLTGVRIKTWQGGFGSASNIIFSNISMSDVKTAIVIDQNYCGGEKSCNTSATNKAVSISGIQYKNIIGTYVFQSVSLVCSMYHPCRNITLDTINLTHSKMRNRDYGPYCSNAYGDVTSDNTPPLHDCLLHPGAPAPSMKPNDDDYLFGFLIN